MNLPVIIQIVGMVFRTAFIVTLVAGYALFLFVTELPSTSPNAAPAFKAEAGAK